MLSKDIARAIIPDSAHEHQRLTLGDRLDTRLFGAGAEIDPLSSPPVVDDVPDTSRADINLTNDRVMSLEASIFDDVNTRSAYLPLSEAV